MKLHKIILLLILLSGFSIEIPAQNSLQNEIGKLEYDTLKNHYIFLLSLIISLWEWKWRKFRDNWNVN